MIDPTPPERHESDGRWPDFVMIGAMKAGTTTLFEQLRVHPQILMAEPKEPNYFSMDEVYARGPGWYRGLFRNAVEGQLCGEASPSYSRYPRFAQTVDRMAQDVPHAKLLYVMRHPVERFYSNYVYDRSFGFKDSIRQTLSDRPYVLETSRYMDQIGRFLERFPREQLHCVLLDDLRDDSAGVMRGIARFLEINDFGDLSPASTPANQRGGVHAVRRGRQALSALRAAPGMSLLKRLAPRTAREAVRNLLTETLPNSPLARAATRRHLERVEPLTEPLRVELHRLLDPATERLESFLGRDLSHWRLGPAGARPAGEAREGVATGR